MHVFAKAAERGIVEQFRVIALDDRRGERFVLFPVFERKTTNVDVNIREVTGYFRNHEDAISATDEVAVHRAVHQPRPQNQTTQKFPHRTFFRELIAVDYSFAAAAAST